MIKRFTLYLAAAATGAAVILAGASAFTPHASAHVSASQFLGRPATVLSVTRPEDGLGTSLTALKLAAQQRAMPAVPAEPLRVRAIEWAERQAGHGYCWGGIGPCFDCSGLVMEAYLHVGVHLPRTTYGMVGSRLLVRVYHPERGDLAFYTDEHVEMVTKWWHMTFGAHDYSSPVGWIRWGGSFTPTMFYRVR